MNSTSEDQPINIGQCTSTAQQYVTRGKLGFDVYAAHRSHCKVESTLDKVAVTCTGKQNPIVVWQRQDTQRVLAEGDMPTQMYRSIESFSVLIIRMNGLSLIVLILGSLRSDLIVMHNAL